MSKKLVAYFSASGATAKIAETLAEAIGADIYEIEPDVRYTPEDLNWKNKQSRSCIEMSDPTSRPAIKQRRDNMDNYDVLFVGFYDGENKKQLLFRKLPGIAVKLRQNFCAGAVGLFRFHGAGAV